MDNSIIPIISELEQRCTKCGILKSFADFYKGDNKNKLRWVCKTCDCEYTKNHYRDYYLDNIEYFKTYYQQNKIKRNEYKRLKCQSDIVFHLLNVLRARLNGALHGNPKLSTTMKLVGCSIEKLKKYLESKFTVGMSWENYGYYGWHIDHIRPCSSFDLSKSRQQRKCFHYTNLQPLWREDNQRKHNNFEVKE